MVANSAIARFALFAKQMANSIFRPVRVAVTAPTGPTIPYDVIIVGAGMAGLSAAYELKKAGLSVKILEQTDRFGGRVYTYSGSKYNLAPGIYAEGTYVTSTGLSVTCMNFQNDANLFLSGSYRI